MYKFHTAQRIDENGKVDIATFVEYHDAAWCSKASGGNGEVKTTFVYLNRDDFNKFHDDKIRAVAWNKLTADERRALGLIEYAEPQPQGFR